MDTDSTASAVAEPSRRAAHAFRWAAGFVLLVAVVLRTYDLDRKPFHHDEGVNGYFLTHLFRQGAYTYDPTNYHGPSLYYCALATTFLFGLDNIPVRAVTVVFGLALVLLCLGLRRWLGDVAALAAALLAAISPGMVYFSRYFIHEILLIAATLGVVWAACRFGDRARLASLLAMSSWAAWMVATKELAVPTFVVLLAAVGCGWVFYHARQRWRAAWPYAAVSLGVLGAAAAWVWRTHAAITPLVALSSLAAAGMVWTHYVWRWRQSMAPELAFARLPWRDLLGFLATAAALFLLINILLYSSFFTNPAGVLGPFKAIAAWMDTGNKAHTHPWWQYLNWLWRAETPIVILGGLGLLWGVVRAESRFIAFLCAWLIGILAAYSLVPYKTPWLTLNILLPLTLLAGHAVDALVSRAGAVLGVVVLLAASSVGLRQSIDVNFSHYDDEAQVYVYAHTRRSFLDMIAAVNRIAALSGQGFKARIEIPAKEHWPLPWYLRRYTGAVYEDVPQNARMSVMVIAGSTQEDAYAASLGGAFDRVGRFALRPGVDLVLFARKDLMPRATVTP